MEKLVVKEGCIGCGICIGENPDYFEFGDDGLSKVVKEEVAPEDKERLLGSVEKCPMEVVVIEEEKIA